MWENTSQSNWEETSDLKNEVFNLQTAQRNELYQVQAKNEGLLASNEWLSAAKERLEQELEAWENGSVSSVRKRWTRLFYDVPRGILLCLRQLLDHSIFQNE